MGTDEARRLCDEASSTIVAAAGMMGGLACVAAGATMATAAAYLAGAAGQLPNTSTATDLMRLSGDALQRSGEAYAIQAIPWPFIYAAIPGWVHAVTAIKDAIPNIGILSPVRTLALRTPELFHGVADVRDASSDRRWAAAGLLVDSVGGHRGKGPKGYRRPDARIEEDVGAALCHNDLLDASDIELKVAGGEVTMQGEVANMAAKRRAEDCALLVDGVVEVQNLLRTKRPVASGASG